MKVFHFLTIITLCVSFVLSSCSDSESERIRKEAKESLESNATPAPAANAFNGVDVTPTPNGEPHYKCPNNCAGGTGSAKGNCPVCSTEMVHNQAFHNTPGAAATPPTTPTTPAEGTVTPPPTPEPAQNASGVWHYTCSKGCAGGAGVKGNCASCGGPLAHNQGYHN